METVDDRTLRQLITHQDTRRKGFELMVRQYSEKLYWLIRRIVLDHNDADDVLQNCFLKAWSSIDSFHGESQLLTWLSRIAINESLDFLRKQKRNVVVSSDDAGLGVANKLTADNYFDGDKADAMLQQAIATLPYVQRTVFLLRYYDEMKYAEISQILNTSEGALKASYHIAVKKITDYFHRND